MGRCSSAKAPARPWFLVNNLPARKSEYVSAVANTGPDMNVEIVRSYRGNDYKFIDDLKGKVGRMAPKWYYLVRHFGISSIECLGRAMGGNPSFC